MSSLSTNSSVNSLMGFSVHQPAIGAPLQFFPAMGSKQLDEMINAYIPGDASILDKRAAVSMEFFEYSMATGDLFKFFMVYPSLGSANTSPMMDSGYQSGFTTSPVMSETQWASSSSRMVSPSSSRKATSTNDFSNLPGMKIMTKDGRDVTNSASRGCKTKEQRDHAHLMRIIKACDSCRRKKTKCDPSHKRTAAGTSSGKVTKKTSKHPRPAAAPPQIAVKQPSTTIEFDQMLSESSSSLDSFFTESLSIPTESFSMEWDQFIQYDEEPSELIPYDYNFFIEPAGYFSPATTASFSSSSTSPSQLPITPVDRDVHITDDTAAGHDHKPILPYLNPGGLEAGDNYVDFNLYSPQSSCLDEELGLAKEVAASPIQSQSLDLHRYKHRNHLEGATNAAGPQLIRSALDSGLAGSYRRDVIIDIGDGLLHDTSNYIHEWSEGGTRDQTTSQVVSSGLPHAIPPSGGQGTTNHATVNAVPAGLSIVDNVLEGVTSEGLYGRETIYEQASSRPLFDRGRSRSQSPLIRTSTDDDVAGLPERQVLLQDSLGCHSADANTWSSSLHVHPYRSCGQDGVNRASQSVASSMTMSILATQTTQLRQTQGDAIENAHDLQPTKAPHVDMQRVPTPDTSSPSPSPTPSLCPLGATMPSARNTRSSLGDTFSWEAVEMNEQTIIEYPASVVAGHSNAKQDRESIVTWNRGSSHCASAIQSLATVHGQSVSSDTTPAASVIASLGVLSVLASTVASRATIAKGNGLVQDVQSVASSNLSRYITAMLLFSLSLSTPSSFILILLVGVLSFVGGHLQHARYMAFPDAKIKPSDAPTSHKHILTKQLLNSMNNFKAASTKVTGLVRCGLAKEPALRLRQAWSIASCDTI